MEGTEPQESEVAPPIEAPFSKRIYMTQEKFLDFVHKLRSQETRLRAYANLHMMLYEKDQELQEKQEIVQHFQTLYTQAQCQIRNLIKAQSDTASADVISNKSDIKVQILDGSQNPVLSLAPTDDADLLQTDGHEEAGVIITVRQHSLDENEPSAELSSEDILSDTVAPNVSVELVEQEDTKSDISISGKPGLVSRSLRPRGLEDKTEDEQNDSKLTEGHGGEDDPNVVTILTVSRAEHETGHDEQKEVSVPKQHISLPPVMPYITGVSRVVFENVVKENVKLKKMLQDVIHRSDIQELLNVREYEDVVRLLRLDLASKQQIIKSLQDDILAKKENNADDLLAKIVKKDKIIERLQMEKKTKQTILESYCKQIENLMAEKQASQQQTAPAKESPETASLFTSDIPSGIPVTVAAQRTDSTREREGETKKEEMEKFQRKLGELTEKYERKISQLKQELSVSKQQKPSEQQINDLSQQNISLQEENSTLRKEIQALKEQESAYKIQMAAFQEDFGKERQEAQKKMLMMRDHYKRQIEQLQGQFTKLRDECDRLNKLLQEERQRKITPSTMIATGICGAELTPPWFSNQSAVVVADGPSSIQPEVKVDDPEGKPSDKQNVKRSDGDGAESLMRRTAEKIMECPRCEMEFKSRKELESHMKKCLDN